MKMGATKQTMYVHWYESVNENQSKYLPVLTLVKYR